MAPNTGQMGSEFNDLGFFATTHRPAIAPPARGYVPPGPLAPAESSSLHPSRLAVDSVELAIPATVPPDALAAVSAAAASAEKLAEQDRELHFELDEGSGRVIIQVRDLDGTVLRTIPPSKALQVLTENGAL